jgi:hypothetical protein
VNAILGSLRLKKHPGKTFIGRIGRGFDFLGYRFTAGSLTLAEATLANFADKLTRPYKRGREGSADPFAPGSYVRRWLAWARGGVSAELTCLVPSSHSYGHWPGSLRLVLASPPGGGPKGSETQPEERR